MTDTEHRNELLRQIKGSPQPQEWVDGWAERMGITRQRTQELIEELIADGRVARIEDRLIVVEHAVSRAEPDEEIP